MKFNKLLLLALSLNLIGSTLIAVPVAKNDQKTEIAAYIDNIATLQRAANNAKQAAKSLRSAADAAAPVVKKRLEQATLNAKNALQKLQEAVAVWTHDPLAKAVISTDWVSVRSILAQSPKPKLELMRAVKTVAEAELLYEQSKPNPSAPEITALERIIHMLDQAIKEYENREPVSILMESKPSL